MIGPSGSGKSTLLRCVNLLEPLDGGRICLRGRGDHAARASDVPSVRQRIGIVFQQFNLFPHLTALDNLTLAARRIRKHPRREAEARAHELLAQRRPRGEGASSTRTSSRAASSSGSRSRAR